MGGGTPAVPETLTPSLAVALNSEELKLPYVEDELNEIDVDNVDLEKGDITMVKALVRAILWRIQFFLYRDLEDAWNTTEGLGRIKEGSRAAGGKDVDIEEKWARLISEMLLCVAYGGPGVLYNTTDEKLFHAMERERDPCYPLVAACEDLCTLAGISRGWKFGEGGYFSADTGVTLEKVLAKIGPKAGRWCHPKPKPNHEQLPKDDIDPHRRFTQEGKNKELIATSWCVTKEGEVIESPPPPPPPPAIPPPPPEKLYPGSVYSFYALDKPGSKAARVHGSHVAFVLRVSRDRTRVQFFDTVLGIGAPQPQNPTPKIVATNKYCRAYDFGWTDVVRGPMKKPERVVYYEGLGVVPPYGKLEAEFTDEEDKAKTLEFQVKKYSTARPLGLARLMLTRRKDDKLIYASPLLPMYDLFHPSKNFSIARYLWSLRLLPGRKQINATWMIFVPRDKLTDEMISEYGGSEGEPCRRSVLQLVKAAYKATKIPTTLDKVMCIACLSTCGNLEKNGDAWRESHEFDKGHVYVKRWYKELDDKGEGDIIWKNPEPNSSLPWERPSGPIKLTREELQASNAEYFIGSWGEREGAKIPKPWVEETNKPPK